MPYDGDGHTAYTSLRGLREARERGCDLCGGPGMMVKPELVERGITQKDFAKMLGIQPSHLSEVLNGKRALSTDLAVKIEEAIGLPAKLLLSAQAQYDLESAQALPDDKQHETVALTIPVQDRNLLREIVRRFGWVCVF